MSRLGLNAQQPSEGLHIVALEGELDLSSSAQLEGEIRRIMSALPKGVLLDLRSLDFLDSSGLRAIVRAGQRVSESGARFAIVRGPDIVHRVFKLTGLDTRFECLDDPEGFTGDA